MVTQSMGWQRIGILIVAASGIVSAFLPWATFPVIHKSMNGFNGVGILSFCVFAGIILISLLGGYLQLEEKTFLLFTTIAGVASLFFTIMHLIDLTCFTSVFGNIEISYGTGIWLEAGAASLIIILSTNLKLKKPARKISPAPPENGISIPATFVDNRKTYPTLSVQEKKHISLEKLVALKENGHITDDELQQLKSKLILSDFLFGLFN